MTTIQDLEKEINAIKNRNKSVEIDKAWETSLSRKTLITILTYAVISIFFIYAKLPKPFLNSIIPALAFLLSTLTIPIAKKIWIKKVLKKRDKIN